MITKIKSMIMSQFVANKAGVDHSIDMRWVNQNITPKVGPQHAAKVRQAVDELETEGLINVEDRMVVTLVLTQKGYNSLYNTSPADARNAIKQTILNQFTKINARAGHAIELKWVAETIMPTLNPAEKEQASPAILALQEEGLIKIEERGIMGKVMALTPAGFKAIS